MSDYRNFNLKFLNGGLDLVSPPDLQEEGRYTQLTNIRSKQEGVLSPRDGANLLIDYSNTFEPTAVVSFIQRINNTSLLVQRDSIIWYDDEPLQLFTGPFPPTGTFIDVGLAPITAVGFKSSNTGEAWTFVGSDTGLFMIRNRDSLTCPWGIPAPAFPMSATVGDPGTLDSSVPGYIDYDWRITYYSSVTGGESNPSPVNDTKLALSSQQATLSGFIDNRIDSLLFPHVDSFKIYRRGGPIVSGWKLVDTVPSTTTEYIDNLSDTTLSLSENLSLENAAPFNTVSATGETLEGTPLPFIWGPFKGRYIFACGDPNRPGFLYWTNPDNPGGASPFNNISVTSAAEPLMNGFVYGQDPFVWSRDNLYALDFGGPNAVPTFVSRQIPLGMGLSLPYAFSVASGAVFFLSKDGIYATDCTSELVSLTKDSIRPLFMNKEVEDFKPIDFTAENDTFLAAVGQELHFLYIDTDGERQHLVCDIPQKRWRKNLWPWDITAVTADTNQSQFSLLMGSDNGQVYQSLNGLITDDGTAIEALIETGAWDSDIPLTMKEYGNCILDADPKGTDITITPIYDAGTVVGTPVTVTGTGRQPYPFTLAEAYHRNVAFRVEMTQDAEIYQIVLLFRDDEEPIKHWEQPPSSFGEKGAGGGLPGWFHVRDGYFGLRSTTTVTLTQTIDGVPYTYSLPSTEGLRDKVYVKFRPVKGKMYQWQLDSDEVFRFYGEDTILNIKPWNSALGYTPQTPFLSVGYAPYLRKGAGT